MNRFFVSLPPECLIKIAKTFCRKSPISQCKSTKNFYKNSFNPSLQEWLPAKEQNVWELDFPNLPYFVDGDIKLSQSNAILRHIGRKHGLYGLDDKHAAEIDMLLDTIRDVKIGLIIPNVLMKNLVSNLTFYNTY